MLSPGMYYKSVPREYHANLRFRKRVLEAASGNEVVQAQLIAMCRQDILFFLAVFIWQYNPLPTGDDLRAGPFIPWAFQDRAILDSPESTGRKGLLWCYENQKTAVVEKSRDMGASWLFLILQIWLCLFFDDVQALDISRSEAAVDSKSRNALFPKIRHMLQHLPDWMKGNVVDTKLNFFFPKTNSEITGEASTKRAGVGGRGTIAFIDEVAEIEEAQEMREKTASTTNCRFFNSTHLGVGTAFYDMTQEPEIVKIQMHWTQHPKKNKGMYRYNQSECKIEFLKYVDETDQIVLCENTYEYPPNFDFDMSGAPTGGPFPGIRSPWYDAKAKEIGTARGVAMQLDINPQGSVAQFYPALLIRSLKQKCSPPLWEGELEYDKATGDPIRLVRVAGGPIKLWLNPKQEYPPRVPSSKYGAGVDVSQGTGATNSCVTVADGRTGRKVLEYQNPEINPTDLGTLVVAICNLFTDENGDGAGLAWENAGPGTAFGKRVWKELGYRNLYRRTAENDMREKVSEIPGWHPNGQSKLILHQDYLIALKDGLYENPSERALDETLAFKHTSNGSVEHSKYSTESDPSGARENHGDVVTSDALSYKMIKNVARQVQEAKKEEEINILTLAGRREIRERLKREEVWS